MTIILQNSIPYDPLTPRPLPGIQPTSLDTWLYRDDAFAAQMQHREALLRERRDDVLALDTSAEPAAQEVLDLVLQHAYPGCSDHVVRPDGKEVSVDHKNPMDTLCRLVQEDICILQKHGDEHVLTGAILCFPASWRLSEKFMRPLVDIHVPVASYDENIARRVQRLFDGIQPDRPLWRFNALWYEDAELHQPRSENAQRETTTPGDARYLRSERQTLLRLPKTRAVVFSIHTYVLEASSLPKMENPA
ncbi:MULTISPECIES: DUF3445 domain-containing protein [unclassified Ruegeria]|uniref:heme-dependent oxidative N-demethylase family protein n=1 Tax=unclassified Ruegeria TaxID=2625375 RepID=UPI001489A9D1|nr:MULTISPECIES: DUF3445 domain-containing protein [unclassified Ruegeria]